MVTVKAVRKHECLIKGDALCKEISAASILAKVSRDKYIEQFVEENHLRWDSLGEYLATAISFQELGTRSNKPKATLLGDTLMNAVGRWLDDRRTPGRKIKQIIIGATMALVPLQYTRGSITAPCQYKPIYIYRYIYPILLIIIGGQYF